MLNPDPSGRRKRVLNASLGMSCRITEVAGPIPKKLRQDEQRCFSSALSSQALSSGVVMGAISEESLVLEWVASAPASWSWVLTKNSLRSPTVGQLMKMKKSASKST